MNAFAKIVLGGWIPIVFLLFLVLPRRKALLTAIVGGWLFLPVGIIRFPGLPDFDKVNSVAFAPLVAVLLLDTSRLFRFRPNWRDLPMAVLCVCPLFSSLANGLGVHDGLASMLISLTTWGIPWLLGRIYLRDGDALRLLARSIVVGGLLYVPLCLFEMKMSPQLHRIVYGFHPHSFAQTARFGGWRPDVFMSHGLMVAFWMMAAALIALVLTRVRVLRLIFGIPAPWCAAALVVTAILCKSFGAIVLLAIGWIVTWLARRRRAGWLLWLLLIVPSLYVGGRVSGVISRAGVNALLSPLPKDRVESVDYRLKNEDPMVAHALQQPLFGWGGWGRARLLDEEGTDITTADSVWVVYLGRNGLVGLVAVFGSLLIAPLTFLRRFRPGAWNRPAHAPAFCVALIVILFGLDCMLNAMINPVYVLAMGALVSLPRPLAAPRPAVPVSEPALQSQP
jgi:O-antigen ligase/polysaccharide polymerase Wzy-like membrane protein